MMNKKISIAVTLVLTFSVAQGAVFACTQKTLNNQDLLKCERVIKYDKPNALQLSCICNSNGMKPSQNTNSAETKDIVDIASSDSRFKTLTAALKVAGLVNVLKGDGPFTVFAPTDEAFAKLAPGTLDELLKPENKDTLVNILTYHVIGDKVTAADAVKLNGKEASMVNGDQAKIEVRDGLVYIDGAKVTSPDIMARNGVIHVIDTVMMPTTN